MLIFKRFMSPKAAQRFADHCQYRYGRKAIVRPSGVVVKSGYEIFERLKSGDKDVSVSVDERIQRDVYSFTGRPVAA